MVSKVSGIDDGSSNPRKLHLATIGNSSQVKKIDEDGSSTDNPIGEIQAIDLKKHPNLFSGLRNISSPTVGIRRFFNWVNSSSQIASSDVLTYNPSLSEALEDLLKEYSKNGIDLVQLLFGMLVKSREFTDKITCLRLLSSLDKREDIFTDFITPYLEKRETLKDIDSNNNFLCYFLTSQDEDDLKEIFKSLDYNSVSNFDRFANSLLKITPPDFVLGVLLNWIKELNMSELEDENDLKKRDQIQKVSLAVLKILNNASPEGLKGYAESLYTVTTNRDTKRKLAKLMLERLPREALRIFINKINDSNDLTEIGRSQRFHAIGDYVNAVGAFSHRVLGEFVKEEQDPFLVAHACYSLINSCEIDGKNILIQVIDNDIKENKPSVVLASVTQMVGFGERFLAVLRGVIQKNYEKGNDLKQAYNNLAKTEFGKIYRKNGGVVTFRSDCTLQPDLVFNLVSNLGLETFAKWIAYGEGKDFKERENFKANALDILDYAWETNRNNMKELALQTMPFIPNEAINAINELIGMTGT